MGRVFWMTAGRKPEHGSEHTREMKRVGEARLLGHLFDQRAGLLQAFGDMFHLDLSR